MPSEVYDSREQDELLAIFSEMLEAPTGDGGKKRAQGVKVSWKVDKTHEAALFSHLSKWKKGEKRDDHSGAHPLVHMAWRALAIAYQETVAERFAEAWAAQQIQDYYDERAKWEDGYGLHD